MEGGREGEVRGKGRSQGSAGRDVWGSGRKGEPSLACPGSSEGVHPPPHPIASYLSRVQNATRILSAKVPAHMKVARAVKASTWRVGAGGHIACTEEDRIVPSGVNILQQYASLLPLYPCAHYLPVPRPLYPAVLIGSSLQVPPAPPD